MFLIAPQVAIFEHELPHRFAVAALPNQLPQSSRSRRNCVWPISRVEQAAVWIDAEIAEVDRHPLARLGRFDLAAAVAVGAVEPIVESHAAGR